MRPVGSKPAFEALVADGYFEEDRVTTPDFELVFDTFGQAALWPVRIYKIAWNGRTN